MFFSDKIVGGVAAAAPIPYQVSVRSGTHGGGHFCGGSILDASTILCAAHCFHNKKGEKRTYYVMAGAANKYSNSAQFSEIERLVWNTQQPYQPGSHNNDAVLLKLKTPLTFNDDVKPACLPDADFDPSGLSCYVSGWGTLQSSGSLPSRLHWVRVPMVSNGECNQAYNGIITDAMVCAGQEGKDSCQGDSGGPLVCNVDHKAVLTGIVSFGIGCGHHRYPGVYARVSTFIRWINANIERQHEEENQDEEEESDDNSQLPDCVKPLMHNGQVCWNLCNESLWCPRAH